MATYFTEDKDDTLSTLLPLLAQNIYKYNTVEAWKRKLPFDAITLLLLVPIPILIQCRNKDLLEEELPCPPVTMLPLEVNDD